MNYDRMIQEIIAKNKLNQINQKVYLTEYQKNILSKYKIPYENCNSMSEIIFYVEELLNQNEEDELIDLENVSASLAEFDYYHNYKK